MPTPASTTTAITVDIGTHLPDRITSDQAVEIGRAIAARFTGHGTPARFLSSYQTPGTTHVGWLLGTLNSEPGQRAADILNLAWLRTLDAINDITGARWTDRDIHLVKLMAKTSNEVERELAQPQLPDLVDWEEAAHILGVRRTRFYEITALPDFPQSLMPKSGVWLRSTITQYAEQRRQQQ